jgi:O-acetyl-ADP-ribose deacetylase (regulator of RNase III)
LKGQTVIGTALVYNASVIHAAFFKGAYTTEYKVHKTTIQILFRSITQVSADALVSSDDTRLTMQSGVSLAILKAAGKQVRQEASKHTPLKIGDVAVTSGGKLAAKYIFHAVTTDLDAGRGPSEEDIQTVTRKALELAETLGVRRIVFPILGTGGAFLLTSLLR